MTINRMFVEYFEDVLLPQIPFGGCALDYEDPDEDDDEGDDD